jgi:hypothetical protein
MVRKWILAGVLCLACTAWVPAWADDCDLSAHFGPVSFDNERPVAALRKILAGTGISLIESGEFDGTTISAHDVSGTVGEAVQRLTEGTGLQYSCHNGVMRVSQKAQPAQPAQAAQYGTSVTPARTAVAAPGAVQVGGGTPGAAPKASILVLTLRQGDSLKAALSGFARRYGYDVSWRGDDLFARQDASFTGKTFDEVVNRFLDAARIRAYVTNDEGNILNVFVQ